MSLLFRTLLNAGVQLEFGARAATLVAASAMHNDRLEVNVTPSVTTTTTTTTSTTVPATSQPVGSAAIESGQGSGAGALEDGDATEANSESGPPSSQDVLSQDPQVSG